MSSRNLAFFAGSLLALISGCGTEPPTAGMPSCDSVRLGVIEWRAAKAEVEKSHEEIMAPELLAGDKNHRLVIAEKKVAISPSVDSFARFERASQKLLEMSPQKVAKIECAMTGYKTTIALPDRLLVDEELAKHKAAYDAWNAEYGW